MLNEMLAGIVMVYLGTKAGYGFVATTEDWRTFVVSRIDTHGDPVVAEGDYERLQVSMDQLRHRSSDFSRRTNFQKITLRRSS